MKIFLSTIFCMFILLSNTNGQVNLCDPVDVLKYEPIPVCVSPGHYLKGYELLINDVLYRVTLDRHKKCDFVSTTDTSFRVDNISVGTIYFNIPKKFIKTERPDNGWGYEVVLKNGWTAVFNKPVEYKSLKAYRKSKVVFFYKNRVCNELPIDY